MTAINLVWFPNAGRSGEVHVAYSVLVNNHGLGHGLKLGFLVMLSVAALQGPLAAKQKKSVSS